MAKQIWDTSQSESWLARVTVRVEAKEVSSHIAPRSRIAQSADWRVWHFKVMACFFNTFRERETISVDSVFAECCRQKLWSNSLTLHCVLFLCDTTEPQHCKRDNWFFRLQRETLQIELNQIQILSDSQVGVWQMSLFTAINNREKNMARMIKWVLHCTYLRCT